jgi:glutamate-1-semialdehyde 2,1-aminomutase
MKATLQEVLTEEMYQQAMPLADRFEEGVLDVIKRHELPWIVKRLGIRVEYWFRETPPRNGGEANAAVDSELDRFMHLYSLNRGILMTPFHNMALVASDTTEADVDHHTEVFEEAIKSLL